MPEKQTRRKYTKEFKPEAIQLVETRGNAAEVARNLGIRATFFFSMTGRDSGTSGFFRQPNPGIRRNHPDIAGRR
ncbi:MAG TPA: transposase [bacterium]|nr:transposase [bacterium]